MTDITMPSPVTQNIGPAVAQTISTPSTLPGVKELSNRVTPNQIVAASQIAADRATQGAVRQDKDRTVQTPKKAEAGFAKQEKKSKSTSARKSESHPEVDPNSTFKITA